MASKKKSSYDSENVGNHFFSNQTTLGGISVQIFRDFAKVFTGFSRIFRDFARIFTKSKLLIVRLHPRLLHHWPVAIVI